MKSFDPIWDAIYQSGHINKYPWDVVVSFVFRNKPEKEISCTHILEVGCGAANNLVFAAAEGFCVSGVDASESALAHARQRFSELNLNGNFYQADFQSMPLADQSQDLVIDRAALTCTPKSVIKNTVREIHRLLVPGGRFLFIPYADSHSSFVAGDRDDNGSVQEIAGGTLTGVGQITFLSLTEIYEIFDEGWEFVSIQRMESLEMLSAARDVHAEYRVIVQKKGEWDV